MIHHAGSNHVEINVNEATVKVVIELDCGGMVAVLPERALLTFALVILLGSAAGDELHAFRDNVCACVFDQ